ncbi:hypothetical protein TUM12370_04740 [Salmonella enterica subsp. enterica serovar Choleraesuis]|nr:hypothetical protein TUM12370_04740 [Salmonella enterica subsp. enterica serovar Choleraesuis]
MLQLSALTPLGTGRHRQCFLHPTHPERCIKIVYNLESGGDKELNRELNYYAHLEGRLEDWSGIPRYYGTVNTDLGTGYVYDIIKDVDGTASVSLTEFAKECQQAGNLATLDKVLARLQVYLRDNRIVTMTIKPQNILCQRRGGDDIMPVVVDNIGESTFIPLATWSAWMCARKQQRLWQRFIGNKIFAGTEAQRKAGLA